MEDRLEALSNSRLPGQHRSGPIAALVLVGVLVLYVLSIGPVERMVADEWISSDAVEAYRPIFALMHRFNLIDELSANYIYLWTDICTEPGYFLPAKTERRYRLPHS